MHRTPSNTNQAASPCAREGAAGETFSRYKTRQAPKSGSSLVLSGQGNSYPVWDVGSNTGIRFSQAVEIARYGSKIAIGSGR